MLLLISPINHEEALESIKGGADIVDVKNPKEGSLGANFPWVIRDIREITPEDKLVSATLGDVPYKPGTVSLAAMGAHVSGADYMEQKIMMKQLKLWKMWLKQLKMLIMILLL